MGGPDGGTTPAPVVQGVVTIADGICQEIGALTGAPDWVEVVCQDVAGAAVHIALPRAQWVAVKAKTLADGGPGK
jgi:hypothetical protein